MNLHLRIISVTPLLLALLWINPAISSVTGIAVMGDNSMSPVGIQDLNTGVVEYYIPLNENDSGVYGVVGPLPNTCSAGTGTCADSGTGFGYTDASALTMNLYFDLDGLANKENAVLDIWFGDLDLDGIGINDPDWFFESVSVFGKKAGGALTEIASTKTLASEISTATQDPFTWSLSLSSLALANSDNDVWIQLGFGSETDNNGSTVYATNTAEYLKATISTVPVPAAVWLFGTALLGFVGMSRRTAIT